jgi:hypothetical protein
MTHWSIRKTARRQEQVARLGRTTGLDDDFSAVVDYALAHAISSTQEVQMNARMIDVVIVDDIDINKAMALVREADEGFPFDDNGGDPDGPSWIVEPGDLGRALGPIIERGLGHQVHGVLVDDYRGTDEERTRLDVQFSQWCGFSSRGIAYGIR